MGFLYGPRKGVYTTKRYSERVQKSLKACCKWIYEHTEQHKGYKFADGKTADIWIFKSTHDGQPLQVGYTDESFLVSGSYRQQSWFYKGDGGDTVDLAAFGRKRIALLDCIFSHANVDTTAGTRVSWDTSWKEKPKGQPGPRPYFGSCNADSIYKYYNEKVIPIFGNFEGCYLFLDNASTHKRFKEDISKFTEENLVAWLEDKLEDANYDQVKKVQIGSFLDEVNANAHTGGDQTEAIWKFIRTEKIREYEVAKMAEGLGVSLLYLPPYWPELNAIEKMWARLKAEYRKTDPHLTWQVRLEQAYSKIDTDFITRIISSTIRWAREKHEELQNPAQPVVAHVVIGDLDEDETLEGHGDSGDEEDVDPLELEDPFFGDDEEADE